MNTFNRIIGFTVLVTTLLFFGCATPYQKFGVLVGGFEETQLEPGVYSIICIGNIFTSGNTVRKYILYRAAEVAIANRCDYFAFVKDSRRENVGSVDWVSLANGSDMQGPNANGVKTSRVLVSRGAGKYLDSSGAQIFRVFNAGKLEKYPDAINARKVIERLRPEIEK